MSGKSCIILFVDHVLFKIRLQGLINGVEADVSRIGIIETVLTRKRVRVGVIIFSKLCIAENFVSYSVFLDGLRLPIVVLFALFVLMILPPDNVCPSHTVSGWRNISD